MSRPFGIHLCTRTVVVQVASTIPTWAHVFEVAVVLCSCTIHGESCFDLIDRLTYYNSRVGLNEELIALSQVTPHLHERIHQEKNDLIDRMTYNNSRAGLNEAHQITLLEVTLHFYRGHDSPGQNKGIWVSTTETKPF